MFQVRMLFTKYMDRLSFYPPASATGEAKDGVRSPTQKEVRNHNQRTALKTTYEEESREADTQVQTKIRPIAS